MSPTVSLHRRGPTRVVPLLAATVLALTASACAVLFEQDAAEEDAAVDDAAVDDAAVDDAAVDDAAVDDAAVDDDAFDEGVAEAPEPLEGEGIPMEVREGQFDGALLLVPVMIDDQGPFSFILDTGATNTAIDATLAEELGLPETGVDGEVTGVTGEGEAIGVEVSSWELGDIALEERTIVAIDLGDGDDGLGVDGLIGGDVLAGFGTITVDYDQGTLVVDE